MKAMRIWLVILGAGAAMPPASAKTVFLDDFTLFDKFNWTHSGNNNVNVNDTVPGAVYVYGPVDNSPPSRITHVMRTGELDFEVRFDIRRTAFDGSGSVWIGWVSIDEFAAVYQDYGWETHDRNGVPSNGLFVQLNSGSPHRSHLVVANDGAVAAATAFDPGPMGNDVWHTLTFGRVGLRGYCELRNKATGVLVARAEVALPVRENYAFFHISSIQGISNNWWIKFEIDNLSLSAAFSRGDLNCDGALNFADINPFTTALGGEGEYYKKHPGCDWLNADCNGDGVVNFADINPFVELLSSR